MGTIQSAYGQLLHSVLNLPEIFPFLIPGRRRNLREESTKPPGVQINTPNGAGNELAEPISGPDATNCCTQIDNATTSERVLATPHKCDKLSHFPQVLCGAPPLGELWLGASTIVLSVDHGEARCRLALQGGDQPLVALLLASHRAPLRRYYLSQQSQRGSVPDGFKFSKFS